jgi:two-component system nitrogen regulation response regulator NtrX
VPDISVLVQIFLEEFAIQNRSKRKIVTSAALDILCSYSWPGNVRELRNLVERLSIMIEMDEIDVEEIPISYKPEARVVTNPAELHFLQLDDLKKAKKSFEKEYIQRKLMENQNNITKTAESIGVGRSYLHKKIKTFK